MKFDVTITYKGVTEKIRVAWYGKDGAIVRGIANFFYNHKELDDAKLQDGASFRDQAAWYQRNGLTVEAVRIKDLICG